MTSPLTLLLLVITALLCAVSVCNMRAAALFRRAEAAFWRGDRDAGDRLVKRANRWFVTGWFTR